MAETSADGDDTAGWFSEETATFGDRLAGAREAAGMSQADLARALGVKLRTVRSWEDDLLDPRANRLQMTAGLLNVSVMWLLTGRGDGIPAPVDEATPGPDARRLIADLRSARNEAQALADRLGTLEKRLRQHLAEAGL